MSIQLKLDAPALATLFPEGSEVRLELQRSVISEMARKIVDRDLAATRNLIEQQCRAIVEKALADEGLTSKVWQGVKLSDEIEKRLKAQATEAATTAVSKALFTAMAPLLADLDARIQRYADSELQVRMNVMAKKALQDALK